jgi:SAM-dependent methyltransferase
VGPEQPRAERYADYDALAWFYNRYWGGFAQRVWPVVERLCLTLAPPGGRILDLCCGTGQLAVLLLARGYRVTGLDGSEAMLRFARENAPGAEFILADARAFSLPAAFDAAVSTFDSLNHIMTIDDLTAVFENVRAVLRPRAAWLFDLNMEQGYRARWRGTTARVEADHVIVDRSSYDPDARIGRSETTMFRPGTAGWQRSDLTLLQRCYTEDEIGAALQKSGFDQIAAYDAERDLEWTGHVGRTFFHARSP